jgi:hypothetical protein
MKPFAALLIAFLPSLGCAQLAGTTQLNGSTALNVSVVSPAISAVTETSSASTIAVKFATNSFATPGFACGTVSGTYDIAAKDNSIDVLSPINHTQIVADLSPSTTYYCQIAAANTAGSAQTTFSIATKPADALTPITSVSFTTPISVQNEGNCVGNADTFYNAQSNDGFDYFTNDDTGGWQCNGVPGDPAGSSNMTVGRWISTAPLEGYTVNFLTGFGIAGSESTFDTRSAKTSGLFAMAGGIFVWTNGQQNTCCGLPGNQPAFPQSGGNPIASFDHGVSWNNFQEPDYFRPNGKPTTVAMFTPGGKTSGMGSCNFIMYGADDGSLGYFNAADQHDGGDAFIYLVCNDGYWNNGNAYYLARVSRAKFAKGSTSADYQYFTGGDGSQDSAWSSSESDATAILTNTGELSWAAIQYVPGRGYLLFTFYYTLGLAPSNSHAENTTWLTYYMAHPWSAPTLINTTNWATQGYYNPIPVAGTLTGSSVSVVFTGSFGGGVFAYWPFTSTVTF